MKPILLIDAYAWIYRSYYAVRALTNSQGVPTNAVFAMLRFLLKIQDEYPEYDGAFVFDEGKPQHRLALAPLYKANRPPMPDDLRSQLSVIRELIGAFGWQCLSRENWEADDLIGCIVHEFPDRQIRIASGDKDLSQLIDSPRVEMLVPSPDGKALLKRGNAETVKKFGVPPCAILDYLALVGDTSDNIPGIPGVGPKTAAQLLNDFGSIDAILANPEQIKRETLREKLVGGAEQLKINRELVRLLTTPCEGMCLTAEQFQRATPDYAGILALAQKMELRSMYKELEKRKQETAVPETTPDTPWQPELF